ncbi:hypothetical protein JAAARDRAFT_188282 [Jaapia argillacea MUCL 33604]|uniref:Uncharacterized protein n=1 Tax=Jaapia argillacea MUCL 33604 TaxID=933084 RepID=A0A067QDK5_9AGAM|nr:hypothetical protein JAAARDRAFT_188282 [Jaapia argillacea MUCL 33604]
MSSFSLPNLRAAFQAVARPFVSLSEMLLTFTIYPTLQSSTVDFEAVFDGLSERRKTDINVLLGFFAFAVAYDNGPTAALAATLLSFTYNLRNCYQNHSATDLKTRIEATGHRTFAVLNTIPSIGIFTLALLQAIQHLKNPIIAIVCVLGGYLPTLSSWMVDLVGRVMGRYKKARREVKRSTSGFQDGMGSGSVVVSGADIAAGRSIDPVAGALPQQDLPV